MYFVAIRVVWSPTFISNSRKGKAFSQIRHQRVALRSSVWPLKLLRLVFWSKKLVVKHLTEWLVGVFWMSRSMPSISVLPYVLVRPMKLTGSTTCCVYENKKSLANHSGWRLKVPGSRTIVLWQVLHERDMTWIDSTRNGKQVIHEKSKGVVGPFFRIRI